MKNKRRKILRWLLWSLLLILVIIISGSTFLYVNRDDLTKKLLLTINSYTQGELVVDNVTIDPIVHFPNIALSLQEVMFYERKREQIDSSITPICETASINISFDIIKLLRSEVEITEISIEGGHIYLVQNEQGVFNIESALKLTAEQTVIDKEEEKSDTSGPVYSISTTGVVAPVMPPEIPGNGESEDKDHLEFNIEELHLQDIDIVIDMIPTDQQQRFDIKKADASFRYVPDQIQAKFNSDFDIKRLGFNKYKDIEDEELSTKIDFSYNKADSTLNILKGDIGFHGAFFKAEGLLDFRNKGMIDLKFEADDKKQTFKRLFLSKRGFENLKSGQLYFYGTIIGEFKDQIPNISCDFGISRMTIEIPQTEDYIRNLNVNGRFASGNRADLSSASLRIDTLNAELSSGYIRASSRIQNLKSPRISYDLDASFRLDKLNEFFDLDSIKDLTGKVRILDQYKGSIVDGSPEFDQGPEDFSIMLDSVSFVIPEVIDIDFLEGTFTGTIDSLKLDSIRIRSRDSDLMVNGLLSDFSNMIFEEDSLLQADLNIRSQKFNFPVLFRALPKTASDFPHVIRDLTLNVVAETSLQKLGDYRDIPEMEFEIGELSANVDSLFDYVRLRQGIFDMYEADSLYFLDFKNFRLLTDGRSSDVNFRYIDRLGRRDSMILSLKTKGINPTQILYSKKDTIPGVTNAVLSGNYNGYILLPLDSTKLFHHVSIGVDDFAYITEDTISAGKLTIRMDDVLYYGDTTEPFLATVESDNDILFKDLVTPFFQTNSLGLYLTTEKGIISISPYDHEMPGRDKAGTIQIYANEEPPRFELDYTIRDLPLEEILKAFQGEELLHGTVDVKIDLDATGLDKETITSSLSGSLYVVGDSLKLYGLDLDGLIKDFQRSQSFDLVDIGAVVLAGPAGILFSKGSDYAQLIASDRGILHV